MPQEIARKNNPVYQIFVSQLYIYYSSITVYLYMHWRIYSYTNP